MNALILAGGKGTRLAPYTTVFPKPMLPVGDRPILDIIIKQLAYYGFKNIALSVGYMAELIQAYYHNSDDLPEGINLTYVKEKHPLGTAGPLSLIPKQEEPFLVMNGDTLTTLDYRKLVQFHKEQEGIVTIASHKRQVNIDFGVLNVDAGGILESYDEKEVLTYPMKGLTRMDGFIGSLKPWHFSWALPFMFIVINWAIFVLIATTIR